MDFGAHGKVGWRILFEEALGYIGFLKSYQGDEGDMLVAYRLFDFETYFLY